MSTFFKKHSINIDIHVRMSNHHYKHTYIHPTPINISKITSRLNLKILEVGYQERLTIDEDINSF
jgi:hypothetical protein